MLSTYTKIAKSNTVLEQVINLLHLDMSAQELSPLVQVEAVNNTQVFKISVSNANPELASRITNQLLEVFSKEVGSLYHVNNIYIMDEAEPSNTPYNIHHAKDLMMFFMFGLVASFGLVVIFYLLDNTIKSEKDIEDYTGLSVLASIPFCKNLTHHHRQSLWVGTPEPCYLHNKTNLETQNAELIVKESPNSPISECFKTFRTNVMFSIQNKAFHTILVTSGDMSEGKSFVSSNLAVAFANSGKKVILIDTDMRKGRVHKIFGLQNEAGLSTCLSEIATKGAKVNIKDFIRKTSLSNLHVMTSGIVPPNPSELLSSSHMARLLQALNTQYDVVICDGTPCMLVSDSIILSKMVDCTLLVTANKTTKLDTLLKMKKSIELVGGNIGGAVFNMASLSGKSYQNGYYYGTHEVSSTIVNNDIEDISLDMPLFVEDTENISFTDMVPSFIENSKNKETSQDVLMDTSKKQELPSHHSLLVFTDILDKNAQELAKLKVLYQTILQHILEMPKPDTSSNVVLEELQILKQIYQMGNSRHTKQFGELENRMAHLESFFTQILEEVKNKPTSSLDIDTLNHKVVQIQDYLERSTPVAQEPFSPKTGKKDKNVLSGQMNFMDDLLEPTEEPVKEEKPNVKEPSFVVDYEAVKKKQERKGVGLFKTRPKKMEIEEEENVAIVSQILLNHTESVG